MEMEQDLSVAQSDCKRSQGVSADLQEQVEKLQAELQTLGSSADKGSEQTQAEVAKVQGELASSQEDASRFQAQLEEKEQELKEALAAANALQQGIEKGQCAAEDVMHYGEQTLFPHKVLI